MLHGNVGCDDGQGESLLYTEQLAPFFKSNVRSTPQLQSCSSVVETLTQALTQKTLYRRHQQKKRE